MNSGHSKRTERLHEQISALLDHSLSDEDREEVIEQLRSDAEARELYFQYVKIHALLQGTHASREDAAGEPSDSAGLAHLAAALAPESPGGEVAVAERRPFYRRALTYLSHPVPLSLLVATVTTLAWLSVLAVFVVPEPDSSRSGPMFAARVVRTVDAEWAGEARFAGEQLAAGETVKLSAGLVELAFADEAKVILRGPATFQLQEGQSGYLHVGELTCRVAAGKQGFSVKTPTADIVDLGTEFGVFAESNEATEVHVFSGAVRLADRDGDSSAARRVEAGTAVRLISGGEFQQVVFRAERFVRSLPTSPRSESTGAGEIHVMAARQGGLIRSNGQLEVEGNSRGVRRIGSSIKPTHGLVNALLFRLPEIDDPDNITSAELTFTFDSVDGEPDFTVDLYGLGLCRTGKMQPEWYYEGTRDSATGAAYDTLPADAPVVRLAESVLHPQADLGRIVISGEGLRAYVQRLYRAGARAGDAAVFRFNAVVDTTGIARATGYNIVHAPAVRGHTHRTEIAVLSLQVERPNRPEKKLLPLED